MIDHDVGRASRPVHPTQAAGPHSSVGRASRPVRLNRRPVLMVKTRPDRIRQFVLTAAEQADVGSSPGRVRQGGSFPLLNRRAACSTWISCGFSSRFRRGRRVPVGEHGSRRGRGLGLGGQCRVGERALNRVALNPSAWLHPTQFPYL